MAESCDQGSQVPFGHEVIDRRGKQHLLVRLPRAESLVAHDLFFGAEHVSLHVRRQEAADYLADCRGDGVARGERVNPTVC